MVAGFAAARIITSRSRISLPAGGTLVLGEDLAASCSRVGSYVSVVSLDIVFCCPYENLVSRRGVCVHI
eukprot:SAG31_NODE_28904_length_403_cov_2.342105_1_plen_68_part_01